MSGRLKQMLENAGVPATDVEQYMDGIGDFASMLAMLLEATPEAPNFITIHLESTGDDDYELTIRKLGGMSPANKIAALEQEVRRLRIAVRP